MKVLALIERPNHVCYRYRLEAFAWDLAERGLLLETVPLGKGLLRRAGHLLAASRADVVILQRRLLPVWQLSLLRLAARRLIYDVDDALFQRDSYHPKGPQSSVRQKRFAAVVKAADLVIAGNEFLKRRAEGLTGPERVHVVPTCVEPAWYRPAEHRRRGGNVRLAWIGQQSTMQSLERIETHLAETAARLPGLELRVICDAAPAIGGVRIAPRPWSSATEAADLAECDIGVNWLPDDSWSRGKCGLRVLQYLAAGLPVVANPVGMNCALVIPGETGLLATTPREWTDAIARLAADPELRRRMGAAGRRLVAQRYGVRQWSPRLVDLVVAAAHNALDRLPSCYGICDREPPADERFHSGGRTNSEPVDGP